MRKILVGVLICLIIILLAGILYVVFFQDTSSSTPVVTQNVTPAAPTAPPPTAVAQGFYAWYLRGEINDQDFASSSDYTNGLAEWLTPNFLSQYQTLAENTDEDPFTLTQDYQDSWATNIQIKTVSQTNTSSTILVTLGTGNEAQTLYVRLLPISGYWKIDSIALQ